MPDHAEMPEEYVKDCYHEAAHAVFYRRAGLTVHGVSVPPGSTGGQGLTRVEVVGANPPSVQALDVAAGDLAGWYAEYKRLGQEALWISFPDFVSESEFVASTSFGSTLSDILKTVPSDDIPDDFLRAFAMLDLAAGSPGDPRALESSYKEVCRKVKRGLQDWWPEVDAVATRLIVAGQLDDGEIAEAIEGLGSEN